MVRPTKFFMYKISQFKKNMVRSTKFFMYKISQFKKNYC